MPQIGKWLSPLLFLRAFPHLLPVRSCDGGDCKNIALLMRNVTDELQNFTHSAGSISPSGSGSGSSFFSSFFRPFFFSGFSGVNLLLDEPGMKCEKISVCLRRNSKRLTRFVSTSVSLPLGFELDSFCEEKKCVRKIFVVGNSTLKFKLV